MTKKDYIVIADALIASKPEHKKSDPNDTREAWTVWCVVVDRISDVLAKDSANFDRAKFLNACLGK